MLGLFSRLFSTESDEKTYYGERWECALHFLLFLSETFEVPSRVLYLIVADGPTFPMPNCLLDCFQGKS